MPTKTKTKGAATSRQVLSRQLRAAILDRGLTAYALGRDAGVDAGVIQRFLNEERDIRMETADRLAEVLGLRLVEAARPSRGRPAKSRRPGTPPVPSAPSTCRAEESGAESIPDHS